MSERESDHMRRSTDDAHSGPSLRQIPVTWLVSLCIGLVGHAATMWLAVEKNIDATVRTSSAVNELVKETRELRVEIGRTNIKDLEHDYKLENLKSRLDELDGRRATAPR
jgi:hypothetical protein